MTYSQATLALLAERDRLTRSLEAANQRAQRWEDRYRVALKQIEALGAQGCKEG